MRAGSERGAALASREGIPRVPVGGSPLAFPGPADIALPRGASLEQGWALGCLQCPRFSALLDSQEGWVCRARGSRAVRGLVPCPCILPAGEGISPGQEQGIPALF